jgi:hypothetical protein
VPIVDQNLFLAMGGMAWAFNVTKKPEAPVHWNRYTPLLIAKPEKFQFDLAPRNADKMSLMSTMYEFAKEEGEAENESFEGRAVANAKAIAKKMAEAQKAQKLGKVQEKEEVKEQVTEKLTPEMVTEVDVPELDSEESEGEDTGSATSGLDTGSASDSGEDVLVDVRESSPEMEPPTPLTEKDKMDIKVEVSPVPGAWA